MKKFQDYYERNLLGFFSNKTIRVMKLTLFLSMMTFFQLFATETYSQMTKLTIKLEDVKISDALKVIENQSEFFFLYSPKLIDVERKVNIDAEEESIKDILSNVFDEKVKFVVYDRQIILSPNKQSEVLSAFQQHSITGTITDKDGSPLPGVNVVVTGTILGALTDIAGKYSIEVPQGSKSLTFSFIGMEPQEITIGTLTQINVTMAESAIALDEVVVVGYGTAKKATVTGSISTVNAESLKASSSINFTNSFAGRLPGLVVVTRSSEPGNDNSTLRIRGSNTLGDNSPLIVIDGIANRGMDRLNSEDVESITVLKDASAAIYGAQAANGVILITTKHGEVGKPKVNLTFNQGWSMPTVIPKMADAATYATMINEINLYAGKSPKYTDEQIQKYADGSDPLNYPNTDWFGATFKPAALQQTANFSVIGGNESLKYFISIGGNFQDAIYKNSGTNYSQGNFRSNFDGRISKNINLNLDVSGRQENRNYTPTSASGILAKVIGGYPTYHAYWPNGLAGPPLDENGGNPVVTTTSQTGYNKDTRYILETLLKLNISIPQIKGLSVIANASLDKNIQKNKEWEVPWYLYSWDGRTFDAKDEPALARGKFGLIDPQLTQSFNDAMSTTLNALLNYERSFNNKHNFKLLVGSEMNSQKSENLSAFRKYFVTTAIDQMFAGGDKEKTNNGLASESARLNYFGRINYNFLEKYLVEFVWRYDGSYIFPKDKRFGFFPGISLGWRLSEENFWRNNFSFINYFKLRGSWGQTGNDRIEAYQYLASYGFNSSLSGINVFNNNVESKILSELRIPNPNVTWEVANQSNIGFDANMLEGRLSFSGDYFYNLRTHILWMRNASVPSSSGLALPRENIGQVVNQGFEFTVGYNNKIGGLNYEISVNSSYQQNRIKYWDETPGVPDYQQSTGRPMNSTLCYRAIGIFKDQAAIDAYPHWGRTRPGDIIYEDVNNDGVINGLDEVRQYKTDIPTFTGGMSINLEYKNFYSSILFQWATGAITNTYYEMQGDPGNFFASDAIGRWTEDNPNATKPRTWNRYGEYWRDREPGGNNTYWLKSTDYIRLKNFEIGYNVPNAIPKLRISGLRIFLNGENLITLDKLENFDPEAAAANSNPYPLNKVFNIGVNMTF